MIRRGVLLAGMFSGVAAVKEVLLERRRSPSDRSIDHSNSDDSEDDGTWHKHSVDLKDCEKYVKNAAKKSRFTKQSGGSSTQSSRRVDYCCHQYKDLKQCPQQKSGGGGGGA